MGSRVAPRTLGSEQRVLAPRARLSHSRQILSPNIMINAIITSAMNASVQKNQSGVPSPLPPLFLCN